jgi:predicted ATP-dependent endonuclease of OLD family
MKFTRIQLHDFRCFEHADIELKPITVLIGPNNAGKSSILRAISVLQMGGTLSSADIRSGARHAEIVINRNESRPKSIFSDELSDSGLVRIVLDQSEKISLVDDSGGSIPRYANAEPDNCIIPYYSKRKIHGYTEEVRGQYASGEFNMNYLSSKLSRITVPTFPGHRAYVEACDHILGFTLGAIPSERGSTPGRYLPDGRSLTLEQMGDGVPSIVALLIELVTACGKVFLIEEPENDLHPSALKALLEIILSTSDRNQFIVSTHSNIVLQYLGGESGSIYEITPVPGEIPTSSAVKIADTSAARTAVLRKLGYALSDFDLWDGWIILEESSAERIIRDFLVPLFTPRLTSIRLLAANGVDDAEATFAALHRMVRFTHLEEAYRFTTWVRLDGDKAGKDIVGRLQQTYKQANTDQFGAFSEANFEKYYPAHFASQVSEAISVVDRQARRIAKKRLLDDVIDWLREDALRARQALAESAAEIIDFLRAVERKVDARQAR